MLTFNNYVYDNIKLISDEFPEESILLLTSSTDCVNFKEFVLIEDLGNSKIDNFRVLFSFIESKTDDEIKDFSIEYGNILNLTIYKEHFSQEAENIDSYLRFSKGISSLIQYNKNKPQDVIFLELFKYYQYDLSCIMEILCTLNNLNKTKDKKDMDTIKQNSEYIISLLNNCKLLMNNPHSKWAMYYLNPGFQGYEDIKLRYTNYTFLHYRCYIDLCEIDEEHKSCVIFKKLREYPSTKSYEFESSSKKSKENLNFYINDIDQVLNKLNDYLDGKKKFEESGYNEALANTIKLAQEITEEFILKNIRPLHFPNYIYAIENNEKIQFPSLITALYYCISFFAKGNQEAKICQNEYCHKMFWVPKNNPHNKKFCSEICRERTKKRENMRKTREKNKN